MEQFSHQLSEICVGDRYLWNCLYTKLGCVMECAFMKEDQIYAQLEPYNPPVRMQPEHGGNLRDLYEIESETTFIPSICEDIMQSGLLAAYSYHLGKYDRALKYCQCVIQLVMEHERSALLLVTAAVPVVWTWFACCLCCTIHAQRVLT